MEFLAQKNWDQNNIFRAPTKTRTLKFKKEPNKKAFIDKQNQIEREQKVLIGKNEPSMRTTSGMPTQKCDARRYAWTGLGRVRIEKGKTNPPKN